MNDFIKAIWFLFNKHNIEVNDIVLYKEQYYTVEQTGRLWLVITNVQDDMDGLVINCWDIE